MPVISWVLVIFASLLALLAVMLLVEVVVAIALRSRRGSELSKGPHTRPRVAVVVPALNEGQYIADASPPCSPKCLTMRSKSW